MSTSSSFLIGPPTERTNRVVVVNRNTFRLLPRKLEITVRTSTLGQKIIFCILKEPTRSLFQAHVRFTRLEIKSTIIYFTHNIVHFLSDLQR